MEVVQKEARTALNKALPALHEAIRALDTINKQDIAEVRTFPKPPKLVKYTLQVVCILLQEKQDWDNIKRILSDVGFIYRLKQYDKDGISKKVLRKLRNKLASNADYKPEKVFVHNQASSSLCKWTIAMEIYARVAEEIAPLREHLKVMNQKLIVSKMQLKVIRNKLKEAINNVNDTQNQLKEA